LKPNEVALLRSLSALYGVKLINKVVKSGKMW